MKREYLDRRRLAVLPLSERPNKVVIERDCVLPGTDFPKLPEETESIVRDVARDLVDARHRGAARMLAFGAHTIKNGLAPVLQWLIEARWITHLATNGAGIIHDWEFAFQGESSEDVRANVASGRFGIWEETGRYINLAIAVGAYRGLGYGESVGALVEEEGLNLPSPAELIEETGSAAQAHATEPDRPAGSDPAARAAGLSRIAAAADLLSLMSLLDLSGGPVVVPHPFKRFGLQAAAFRAGIPFTGHPMFGHDIIYNHPANCGSAIGRTAERDFLSYAHSVSQLTGGVYLSVGSAVMSPMIFEKSLSMAQNLAIQEGRKIQDHRIYVVDLAHAPWDWASDGEPPQDNPAYYLRFLKTFHRMGGITQYLSLDNRRFLLRLVELLRE